jgi:type IV secretion system protein VirB6
MSMAPIAHLEQAIDRLLASHVNAVSAHLSGALGGVAIAGLTIYYLMLAYGFARGEVSEPLGRLLKDGLGQLLICTLVFGGMYQSAIVQFFQTLQTDLITGVTDGRATSVGTTLDLFFSDFNIPVSGRMVPAHTALYDVALERANAIGIPDLTYMSGALMVSGAFILVATMCLLPALLAKIGLALMLAIGPVFLLLLLWPATRTYFTAWLSATLGFVLTSMLVALVASLAPLAFIEVLTRSLQGIGQDDFNALSMGASMLIVGLGLALAALHVSQQGAQLAGGGISMDSKGIAGTIVQTLLLRTLSHPQETPTSPSNTLSREGQDRPSSGGSAGEMAGGSAGAASGSTRLSQIVSGLMNRQR